MHWAEPDEGTGTRGGGAAGVEEDESKGWEESAEGSESKDGVQGHIVLFARGTHGSCQTRSRCVVNTAELALSLQWTCRRLSLLALAGSPNSSSDIHLQARPGFSAKTSATWRGGDDERGIRIRGGVHVVRTEERSHSFVQLVALMQESAVVVVPHGTQVYNAIFSRPGTVLIEFSAQTHEFTNSHGVGVLQSNQGVARAAGMRTWVLPMEGIGWHISTSVRPFIVDVNRIISIVLHESRVPMRSLVAGSVRVKWVWSDGSAKEARPSEGAEARPGPGNGRRGLTAEFEWSHLNLLQQQVCAETCTECALNTSELARPRVDCLFLAVEVVVHGPGDGEESGGGWRGGQKRELASAPISVGGSCFGDGRIFVDRALLPSRGAIFAETVSQSKSQRVSLVLYACSQEASLCCTERQSGVTSHSTSSSSSSSSPSSYKVLEWRSRKFGVAGKQGKVDMDGTAHQHEYAQEKLNQRVRGSGVVGRQEEAEDARARAVSMGVEALPALDLTSMYLDNEIE